MDQARPYFRKDEVEAMQVVSESGVRLLLHYVEKQEMSDAFKNMSIDWFRETNGQRNCIRFDSNRLLSIIIVEKV